MNKQEKENVVGALINIGFTRRYDGDDSSWIYKGYPIKIKESATLTDVFKLIMRASEELKIWEIKSVLNILQ
jgi:hypothetical protein